MEFTIRMWSKLSSSNFVSLIVKPYLSCPQGEYGGQGGRLGWKQELVPPHLSRSTKWDVHSNEDELEKKVSDKPSSLQSSVLHTSSNVLCWKLWWKMNLIATNIVSHVSSICGRKIEQGIGELIPPLLSWIRYIQYRSETWADGECQVSSLHAG